MSNALTSFGFRRRSWAVVIVFALLALTPPVAALLGDAYAVVIATRIVAFALAAIALDLVLGYGALVSFGHAAFVGIGAYTVAILSRFGVTDVLLQVAVAACCSGAFAAVTGVISLRTRGIYFIMITLAFGQMAYFFFVSLASFGGDDGSRLDGRSTLSGTAALENDVALFYGSLVLLILTYAMASCIVRSRFGRVLTGSRENAGRMMALGYQPFHYQLLAYVISGAMASIAGVILVNQAEFVSPAFLNWQRSGELIVMVVLGGLGNLAGAVFGATVTLLIEEQLSLLTLHWRFFFGVILVGIALTPKGALTGLWLSRRSVA